MRYFLIVLGVLASGIVKAQPGFDPFYVPTNEIRRPVWRKIANMFTFEGSVGHGATLYSHDVSNIPLAMTADSVLILGAQVDTGVVQYAQGLGDWLHMAAPFDTVALFPFAYGGDSVLGFRAVNSSLPVSLRMYFSYDRFRIGGGIHYEWQWFKPMKPTAYQDRLGPYRPSLRRTTLARYYGMVGAKVYSYRRLTYSADLELGMVSMGMGFEAVQPIRRFYVNIGAPIEYNFSEYLRVYLRPSVEFKTYDVNLGAYSTLTHTQHAFYTQLGISYTIPEVRRCPVPACHVQMKHVHQGWEYRGQPINKIQNPGYGENNPVLEKHKWRPFQRQERAPRPQWWQFWRRN